MMPFSRVRVLGDNSSSMAIFLPDELMINPSRIFVFTFFSRASEVSVVLGHEFAHGDPSYARIVRSYFGKQA